MGIVQGTQFSSSFLLNVATEFTTSPSSGRWAAPHRWPLSGEEVPMPGVPSGISIDIKGY